MAFVAGVSCRDWEGKVLLKYPAGARKGVLINEEQGENVGRTSSVVCRGFSLVSRGNTN